MRRRPTIVAAEDIVGPLERAGIPVLQVLRRAGPIRGLPLLPLDDAAGGRPATERLPSVGAARGALLGGAAGRPISLGGRAHDRGR